MSCVVIVEDDMTIRRLLAYVLDRLKLEVHPFEDGATALADLDNIPCDLMLVDYQLPDMTGLELTEAIRSRKPHLPVALVTGSAHLVAPEAMTAVGITQVFPKPFDLEDLTGWVLNQLDVK